MNKNIIRIFLLALIASLMISCATMKKTSQSFPELTGPYLGQTPPGDSAEVFAPGIISNGMNNRDVTMLPDGNEMYFGVNFGNYAYGTIVFSKLVDGKWTTLEIVPFASNSKYACYEQSISPDGIKMFFVTDKPIDEDSLRTDSNIWVMDRVGENWGTPYPLSKNVNSEFGEYFPSVTRDGVLYYTGVDSVARINVIFRSYPENGTYSKPELLPEQANSGRSQYNAFISPDESYLIVPVFGKEDSYGGTDYYIVFRDENDNWSEPISMGPKVNFADPREWSAYVTPDEKHLFFMSARVPENAKTEIVNYAQMSEIFNSPQNGNSHIYWIDAGIIEELREKAVFKE